MLDRELVAARHRYVLQRHYQQATFNGMTSVADQMGHSPRAVQHVSDKCVLIWLMYDIAHPTEAKQKLMK